MILQLRPQQPKLEVKYKVQATIKWQRFSSHIA